MCARRLGTPRLIALGVFSILLFSSPLVLEAAVISEQTDFAGNEVHTGVTPLTFTGPSSFHVPVGLTGLTGTLRAVKLRYDVLTGTTTTRVQMVLKECADVAMTAACHVILARDEQHGWDGSLLNFTDPDGEEIVFNFTSATKDFSLSFDDGYPLDASKFYQIVMFFDSSNYSARLYGIQIAGKFNAFYQLLDEAPTSEPEPLDPVIIIPGILGSERVNGEWVIDPILHIYDDLIETLDSNDYKLGVDLFPFPYDWRKSNVETAVFLKDKIDEIKGTCTCDKVDIVAHSMGGLVARQYIQSDAYENDVDQLIFLGTPHLGAPKAYLMSEGGETDSGISNLILKEMLEQEAKEHGFENLFTYIQEYPIPAVNELLATYSYLEAGDEELIYPTGHPQNNFLSSLNDTVNSLYGASVRIANFIGITQEDETITKIKVDIEHEHSPLWPHG